MDLRFEPPIFFVTDATYIRTALVTCDCMRYEHEVRQLGCRSLKWKTDSGMFRSISELTSRTLVSKHVDGETKSMRSDECFEIIHTDYGRRMLQIRTRGVRDDIFAMIHPRTVTVIFI